MRRRTFWKLCQRRAGRGRIDAHVLGRGDGRQRVELVVLARQRPAHAADGAPALLHLEVRRLAVRGEVADARRSRAARSSTPAPARGRGFLPAR
jgi:hypothetical protein